MTVVIQIINLLRILEVKVLQMLKIVILMITKKLRLKEGKQDLALITLLPITVCVQKLNNVICYSFYFMQKIVTKTMHPF